MNTDILQRHFTRIGASLNVAVTPTLRRFWWTGATDYLIDIIQTRRGEAFQLIVTEEVLPTLELRAVDVKPKQQHLLLLAKRLNATGELSKEKYLCGHDERHWFVAAVPDTPGVATVESAMEALKPEAVVHSQRHNRVKPRDRHKRRNAGFIRQGEWFFVPRPRFEPKDAHLILRKEPLQRGGGKPHIVEEVYRMGGETVYVSRRYPSGLRERAYRQLLQRDSEAARLSWRVMRRNPTVYARGKVRHPDHKTVVLSYWHQVAMNDERLASNVAFLD